MTGRLSEVVANVADNNPLSFIGDFLHWIVQLIHTIFDGISHCVIYISERIEIGVQHLVAACKENSTCSNVAKETKEFAVYWYEQLRDRPDLQVICLTAILCVTAIVILYTFWSIILGSIVWCFTPIYVAIVRCCGFRPRGIRARTFASSYMTTYGGNVPASSNCARYQSIGATGVLHHPGTDIDSDGYDSGYESCCKKFLGFALLVIVVYFAAQWFVDNYED